MTKHIQIVLGTSLIIAMLALLGYSAFEPVITRAAVVTDQVIITLNVAQAISISSPADSTMSTTLGVAANSAVATTTWNVRTNDSSGYNMTVLASTAPAMKSGSLSVADYQTGAPNTWSIPSGSAAFGYSGFGTDVSTGTWGTGTTCSGANANATSTTLKYQGFRTTAGTIVASRAATTSPAGVDTTVCYAVEQNNFFIPTSAATTVYTASITATATSL